MISTPRLLLLAGGLVWLTGCATSQPPVSAHRVEPAVAPRVVQAPVSEAPVPAPLASESLSGIDNEAEGSSVAEQAAVIALGMSGVPYRFGGSTPEGFDCSGLVQYAFAQVGVSVPRTAEQQFRAVRRISLDELAAGDLLFFRLGGRISHVGVYTGDGRFVHAPSTGKNVAISPMDLPYWRKRLVAAGRF